MSKTGLKWMFVFAMCLVGCTPAVDNENAEALIKPVTADEVDVTETYLKDGTLYNPFKITVEKVVYFEKIDFTKLELNKHHSSSGYVDANGEKLSGEEIINILDKGLDEVGYYYVELTFENLLEYDIEYYSNYVHLCEGNVTSSIDCHGNFRLSNPPTEYDDNMTFDYFSSLFASVSTGLKYKEEQNVEYIYDEEFTLFNGINTSAGIAKIASGDSKSFYLLILRQNSRSDIGMSLNFGNINDLNISITDESFFIEHSLPSYDGGFYEYFGPLEEGVELVPYKSER